MSVYERITVRLLPEDADALYDMVDSGKYRNISEAAAAAIREFVETHKGETGPSEVPPLDELIEEEPKGVDQKIQDAVRSYLEKRMNV